MDQLKTKQMSTWAQLKQMMKTGSKWRFTHRSMSVVTDMDQRREELRIYRQKRPKINHKWPIQRRESTSDSGNHLNQHHGGTIPSQITGTNPKGDSRIRQQNNNTRFGGRAAERKKRGGAAPPCPAAPPIWIDKHLLVYFLFGADDKWKHMLCSKRYCSTLNAISIFYTKENHFG